jgi:hypothetical protein
MRLSPTRFGPAALFVVALTVPGCSGETTAPTPTTNAPTVAPLGKEEEAVYRELESKVSALINAESKRFTPLQYQFSEGLLEILDQVDRSLSGKDKDEPPRFLPELSADEQRDHFRETIRRWEAKSGKSLRREIDALKAEVASRTAGEAFHPEFQKKFNTSLDGMITCEVEEIRERRNRAIHEKAEALLASHRATSPGAVRRIEELLSRPPYDVPVPKR